MLHTPMFITEGLYRLVKQGEDNNPVFPSKDTVVELRAGKVINLSTGRSWPLHGLGSERVLYGPLSSPYDNTRLHRLPRIELFKRPLHELAPSKTLFAPRLLA